MKKLITLLSIFALTYSVWAYDYEEDYFYYDIDSIAKTATIVDYDDSEQNVLGVVTCQRQIIYNGAIYTVVAIGNNAFDNCDKIQSITISRTITSIGKRAFYGCSNLNLIYHSDQFTSIGEEALDGTLWLSNQPDGCVYFGNHLYKYKGEMAENTSIEVADGTLSICSHAFEKCQNLLSITLPNSLKLIDKYAFAGCGLTSISIPNSVDSIAIMAFTSCNSLTNIELTPSVKLLKSNVFSFCSALTSIDLSHINNIENGAFTGCTSLNSVIFGDSLSIIDKYAFMNCENLDSLILPATLDSIGQSAFHGCSGIEYMEVQATTPPRIHKNTFDSVSREIKFVVPAESYEAYATHKYWKVFLGGEEETLDEHINAESSNIYYDRQNHTLHFDVDNPMTVIIYDTMGKTILNNRVDTTTQQLPLNLNRGIYIVNILTDNQSTIQTKIMVK